MQIVETLAPAPWPAPLDTDVPDTDVPLLPRLLAAIAIDFASFATGTRLEEPRVGERTFERVHVAATHDIWLIRWAEGSRTALHDHGGSTGAFYVVNGDLVEHRPNPAGRSWSLRHELAAGEYRMMNAAHVHAVANESRTTATSVHVYSPPLTTMQHFETTADAGLTVVHREIVEAGTLAPGWTGVAP